MGCCSSSLVAPPSHLILLGMTLQPLWKRRTAQGAPVEGRSCSGTITYRKAGSVSSQVAIFIFDGYPTRIWCSVMVYYGLVRIYLPNHLGVVLIANSCRYLSNPLSITKCKDQVHPHQHRHASCV